MTNHKLTTPPSETHPPRVERLARHALHAHGTAPLALSLLGEAENITYRVETADGLRLLRLKPPGRLTLRHVNSELLWLRALNADTALAVPGPLPFPNGDLVRAFQPPGSRGEWLAVIFRWVDGEFRSSHLTPADTRQVGRLAAELHAHASAFEPPADFQRPHLLTDPYFHGWESQLSARTDLTHDDRQAVRHAVHTAHQALSAAAHQDVRSHLLHGDLHQGNYLFTTNVAAAIDFDDCQFGPALYDLAATLAHLSLPDHDGSLRAAFLGGYEEIRPLWPQEQELLDAFVTLRHLWMLRWILERDHLPEHTSWAPGYRAWQLSALGRA